MLLASAYASFLEIRCSSCKQSQGTSDTRFLFKQLLWWCLKWRWLIFCSLVWAQELSRASWALCCTRSSFFRNGIRTNIVIKPHAPIIVPQTGSLTWGTWWANTMWFYSEDLLGFCFRLWLTWPALGFVLPVADPDSWEAPICLNADLLPRQRRASDRLKQHLYTQGYTWNWTWKQSLVQPYYNMLSVCSME